MCPSNRKCNNKVGGFLCGCLDGWMGEDCTESKQNYSKKRFNNVDMDAVYLFLQVKENYMIT